MFITYIFIRVSYRESMETEIIEVGLKLDSFPALNEVGLFAAVHT